MEILSSLITNSGFQKAAQLSFLWQLSPSDKRIFNKNERGEKSHLPLWKASNNNTKISYSYASHSKHPIFQTVLDIFTKARSRCCPSSPWQCYHDLLLFLPTLTLLSSNSISSPLIIKWKSHTTASLHSTVKTQEESTGCSHARMWVVVDQKRRSELRPNLGHRTTCTVMAHLKRQRAWSVRMLWDPREGQDLRESTS